MKKGFTLVELLAVIVILAIILAIAIPGISNVINSSTRGAAESNAKMVLKALEYKMLEDNTFDPTTINETNIKSILGIDDSNYQKLVVIVANSETYITIMGKNKWANLTMSGTRKTMKISDTSNFVNPPVLATGMTPIKWSGSTWVETNENDSEWYNYTTTDKKWANVKTTDGSMWVWIPRYIYNISSGWHTSTPGVIDVQFSIGTDDTRGGTVTLDTGATSNASNNKWTNHPAFTFDSTQLTGIWVAKFEATAAEGVTNGYTADGTCVAGDNVTTKTVKVIPNVASWRCIQIGNAFTATRNMETNSVYGWGTSGASLDTHVMKNIEWGAVAYISKSNYGQGINEIYINNNQNYITGCAGNTVSEGLYNGCQNTYESLGGVKASTTGTIYGIYDLSGGAWERMSAYINNGNINLNIYGSSIVNADAKYKDVYSAGETDDASTNYGLTINLKGDGVYEVSNNSNSWFGDNSTMPYNSSPWFRHGGHGSNGVLAGSFNFSATTGGYVSHSGFRPVIIVSAGL